MPGHNVNTGPLGVSIVICCHNSAALLPETLRHLAAQRVDSGLRWEVIVVDNASTDSTAEVARQSWPAGHRVPLRLVYEPRQGLSHARECGLTQARYEIVGLVDDDNWVSEDWVQRAAEIMQADAGIGACGGVVEPVCEVEPAWFAPMKRAVAPPAPADHAADITDTGVISGGGLVIRRSAWQELEQHGFQFILTDRNGNSGSAGGDIELWYALRLAGWKLWFDPRLKLRHFVPRHRIDNWERWRREARGAGMAYPVLALYARVYKPSASAWETMVGTSWVLQAMAAARYLVRRPALFIMSRIFPMVGNNDVLALEVMIGRVRKLLEMRGRYAKTLRQLEAAAWHRRALVPSPVGR